MPFLPSLKKLSGTKPEKNSKPKRKSQFFDTDPTEELDGAETIENAKRKSKSKFYKDLPITKSTDSLDTASIGSTNSHTSSTSKSSHQLPPRVIGLETQGDLGQSQTADVWCRRTSILSRSFFDILHDQDLIGQFIQYMTSKDKGHLVKFWLDSENFTAASLSRMRVQSIHSVVENSSDTSSNNNKTVTINSPSTPKSDTKDDESLQESIKRDAVNIYSKYIALDCPSFIGITEQLRNSTISKICSEDGKVDPLCFKDCQLFVEELFKKEHYKQFLESSFYRRYQVQMIVDGRLHLIDILYNDAIMFYFTEFVEQENASSLLQFWMAVDNFQSQLEYDKYTAKEAQADAMILYEKYFSLQASEPLGFSDKVRMHVELNICREGGPLPDCFLVPKIIILETIEKTLFKPFLQSQIYYRYLSELIASNQSVDSQAMTPKAKVKKSHSRKGSGASSYDAQSLGESSMAEGDVTGEYNSRLNGIDDDTPLWKRVHHRKTMSLGQLSEFGQYVSELELEKVPDIDKHKGNRFSRKKRAKEKEQEAMAWEVTKMIISGVKQEVAERAADATCSSSAGAVGTSAMSHNSSDIHKTSLTLPDIDMTPDLIGGSSSVTKL